MSTRPIVLAGLLAAVLNAQQAGDANRNYTINGNGALAISACLPTIAYDSVPIPGSMTNVYTTSDAAAPVIWATSPTFTVPGLGFGPNEANLGTPPSFANVTFIGDGTQPGFLNSVFRTDSNTGPTHAFTLAVPTNPLMLNLVERFCMIHFSPTSSVGAWVSQTHSVGFGFTHNPPPPPGSVDPFLAIGNAAPAPNAAPIAGAGDDSSTPVALGFSFTFFGVNYSTLYVGSNGYLTSTPFQAFTESVAAFTGGPAPNNAAKICAFWDDFNLLAAGAAGNASLKFATDGASQCEFSWVAVPEFGSIWSATNQNNFKVTLTQGAGAGTVTIDFGLMAALDGLVGLSPGGNPGLATAQSVNFSFGPAGSNNPICTGRAVYEMFVGGSAPNDLAGRSITFLLDSTGTPIYWQ